MFSSYIKSLLIVLIATGFISNGYAAWNYNKNKTTCVNGVCKHTNVHKHCQNGRCWNSKHVQVYDR